MYVCVVVYIYDVSPFILKHVCKRFRWKGENILLMHIIHLFFLTHILHVHTTQSLTISKYLYIYAPRCLCMYIVYMGICSVHRLQNNNFPILYPPFSNNTSCWGLLHLCMAFQLTSTSYFHVPYKHRHRSTCVVSGSSSLV